jgi:hypothetical protein
LVLSFAGIFKRPKGMALGIAATENWISLIINNIVLGRPVNYEKINPVKYGLKMVRYYEECFI